MVFRRLSPNRRVRGRQLLEPLVRSHSGKRENDRFSLGGQLAGVRLFNPALGCQVIRFRYSLRSLICAVGAIGVAVGLYSSYLEKRRVALNLVVERGGRIHFSGSDATSLAQQAEFSLADAIRNVDTIDLVGIDVTDEDVAALLPLREVRVLCIGHSAVTDRSLVSIGKFTELQSLGIQYTGISDAGLSQLSALRHLIVLDLSGTQVSDDCLPHLYKIPSLSQIYIGWTRISAVGRRELVANLPKCNIAELP